MCIEPLASLERPEEELWSTGREVRCLPIEAQQLVIATSCSDVPIDRTLSLRNVVFLGSDNRTGKKKDTIHLQSGFFADPDLHFWGHQTRDVDLPPPTC